MIDRTCLNMLERIAVEVEFLANAEAFAFNPDASCVEQKIGLDTAKLITTQTNVRCYREFWSSRFLKHAYNRFLDAPSLATLSNSLLSGIDNARSLFLWPMRVVTAHPGADVRDLRAAVFTQSAKIFERRLPEKIVALCNAVTRDLATDDKPIALFEVLDRSADVFLTASAPDGSTSTWLEFVVPQQQPNDAMLWLRCIMAGSRYHAHVQMANGRDASSCVWPAARNIHQLTPSFDVGALRRFLAMRCFPKEYCVTDGAPSILLVTAPLTGEDDSTLVSCLQAIAPVLPSAALLVVTTRMAVQGVRSVHRLVAAAPSLGLKRVEIDLPDDADAQRCMQTLVSKRQLTLDYVVQNARRSNGTLCQSGKSFRVYKSMRAKKVPTMFCRPALLTHESASNMKVFMDIKNTHSTPCLWIEVSLGDVSGQGRTIDHTLDGIIFSLVVFGSVTFSHQDVWKLSFKTSLVLELHVPAAMSAYNQWKTLLPFTLASATALQDSHGKGSTMCAYSLPQVLPETEHKCCDWLEHVATLHPTLSSVYLERVARKKGLLVAHRLARFWHFVAKRVRANAAPPEGFTWEGLVAASEHFFAKSLSSVTCQGFQDWLFGRSNRFSTDTVLVLPSLACVRSKAAHPFVCIQPHPPTADRSETIRVLRGILNSIFGNGSVDAAQKTFPNFTLSAEELTRIIILRHCGLSITTLCGIVVYTRAPTLCWVHSCKQCVPSDMSRTKCRTGACCAQCLCH